MSEPTTTTLQSPPPGPPRSPAPDFSIGWRDICQLDGTCERIPLTLEDARHPQMGDVLVESDVHDLALDYLSGVFRRKTAHDPMTLVFRDVGIYWDIPELRHHACDISVILNVKNRKPIYTSFQVAEEGTRPSLIIEAVSPNCRVNDVVTKVEQYHRARVPVYVVLDRKKESDPWILRGYQYAPTKYLPMPKDDKGRLWLDAVGVWLGVNGSRVVCYDGETGEEIPDVVGVAEQLELARTRAEEEKARAEVERIGRAAAEERLRQLEAELAKLKNPS